MSAQSARLGRAIRYLGVVWLIATVLLIGMTVVLGAFYRRLDQSRARANWPAYNQIALQTMTAADATQLFRDCERIAVTTVARPWVEYSERPASFARIHVDTAKPLPLRRTAANSNKSPKRKTFWLFGGSSVFGYGVPDDQTLASHLQNELQRREPNAAIVVVNHGHLGYYSSQELALLQWLVRSGQRADVAVFLDGLNDARTGNEATSTRTKTTSVSVPSDASRAVRRFSMHTLA